MIIVPVATKKVEDAFFLIEGANLAGDAIEIRLDYFNSLSESDLARLIAKCKKPCICTCRKKSEGGHFRGTESQRINVLKAAIKNKAQFIDIEFETRSDLKKKIYALAKNKGTKVILSKHCMENTPALIELCGILEKMAKEKTHVVKIVANAKKLSDNRVILGLFKDANKKHIKLIAFCMGKLGIDSRILSHFAGGFATFASLQKGFESASGQISAEQMRRYRIEFTKVLS